MKRVGLALALLVAALAFAGTAGAVSAPPGGDAQYEIELSATIPGPSGGGVWLWLELDKDYAGIYDGSDCGHGMGAASDQGNLTWEQVGTNLVIHGVVLNGLPPFAQHGDIIVPAKYGHYNGLPPAQVFTQLATFFTVIGAPLDSGFTQVQVAP